MGDRYWGIKDQRDREVLVIRRKIERPTQTRPLKESHYVIPQKPRTEERKCITKSPVSTSPYVVMKQGRTLTYYEVTHLHGILKQ